MFFRRKKRIIAELERTFGQLKDEDFDFEQIEKYHLSKKSEKTLFEVTDQVWSDLDMDLFFAFLDRTSSKVGQQYLYHKLRTINYDKEETHIQEEIIDTLSKERNTVIQLQYWLNKLNSKRVYHLPNLFQGKHIKLPRSYFFVPLLSFTAISTILLGLINPSLYVILLFLFPVNAAFHYLNKRKVNIYIYSIPLLLSLNKVAKVFLKTKELSPISGDVNGATKTIDKIKKRIAVFKLEQKMESELEVIYWFLLEIIKITFLLEPLLLFSVIDRLKKDKKEIETVFEYVGKVDQLLSIISLRHSLDNYCLPQIGTEDRFVVKDMAHPLVSNCTTNSIEADNASCLITGSNMSGKTTFIRAIGLNYLSGLTLNTCFAHEFRMPLVKLRTVIRVSDDISNASSYFFKEMASIKDIIESCDNNIPQLILLDELFKGTNTSERISAAKAILSYLRKHNCIVFVSSHDLELTELLKNEYELYHFSESIKGDQIVFDYKLKKGIKKKGNAIKILELNGFPNEVITEATGIAKVI